MMISPDGNMYLTAIPSLDPHNNMFFFCSDWKKSSIIASSVELRGEIDSLVSWSVD